GMVRSWGFRRKDVTLAVALTGTWNQFILLGLPSVALFLLTIVGEHHALLKTVALVGLGIFVIAASSYAAGLSSRRLARWSGNLSARIASWVKRLFGRGPVSWTGETFAGFRADAVELLGRPWLALPAASLP